MPLYTVLVSLGAQEQLRNCPRRDRERLLARMELLAAQPFLEGDFRELNLAGRPLEVTIIGGSALVYLADHSEKEVKILGIRPADW